jgi:uncharacterized protein YndB with AHSA1/START domain
MPDSTFQDSGGPVSDLPGAERALHKTATVHAPVEDVWWAWTTDAGIRSWLLDDSHIELRVGGAYELYFDDGDEGGAEPGLRGSEGCHILGIQAPSMLTFTWNAPPHLPEARAQRTVVVLRLRPEADDEGTRVALTHVGWGDGGQWDEAFDYFDAAWDRVLLELEEYFAEDVAAPAD